MRRAKPGLGSLLLCGVVACAGVACGGEVRRTSSRPTSSSASNEGSAGKAANGTFGDADTALGDCVLGPNEGTVSECNWVVEGHCYTEREMACNCACPRDRDSQCSSGFDRGSTGHVDVDCF